jgi:hypothetical protein
MLPPEEEKLDETQLYGTRIVRKIASGNQHERTPMNIADKDSLVSFPWSGASHAQLYSKAQEHFEG